MAVPGDIYIEAFKKGLEITGENRQVQVGEWFWDGYKWKSWDGYSVAKIPTIGKYLIGKKKKTFFSFDGREFECPEGFVFERVGNVTKEDIGKYIVTSITRMKDYGPVEVRSTNIGYHDAICAFFRKESE
jgi:hypothetical protein